jgi:hypothetical protein
LYRSVSYGTKRVSSTGHIGDYFLFCEDCLVFKLQSKHVILVGGFAANDYLFERVKAQLTSTGIVLLRPEIRVYVFDLVTHCILDLTSRSNKAVSDGAISFFLDHYVRTRVAKVAYGTKISVPYNEHDQEHVKRLAFKTIGWDGFPRLEAAYDVFVPKVSLKTYHYLQRIVCSHKSY